MNEYERAIVCFERQCASGICTEADKVALAALRAQSELVNQKPMTLEELREMDGESAYVQFGDGAEGNAILAWEEKTLYLYGPEFDDHYEPDLDFINMEYKDPDGHFGLHLLGWRVYRYPPKEQPAKEKV